MHLGERTFSGLHERDRVLGVALGLAEAADLGAQLLADRETGCVVGCAVDAVARRQALHRLAELRCWSHQLPVRVERLELF